MNKNLTEVMANMGNLLMNKIQMGLSYSEWDDAFSYEEIKESYASVKEQLATIIGNINELSTDELSELGFKKWDDESELYLIPLWAYDLIPNGTELTSISGKSAIKGKQAIDLDVRFGCIAWGLKMNVPSSVRT